MCRDLGAQIEEGDLIARIYDIERTGQAPVDYHARVDGIFMGKHFPGLIKPGDFLAVIAQAAD